MTLEVGPRRCTVEEYLRLEAESSEKHEYWDGFIVPLSQLIAMAGGSYEHSLIGANFIRALGNQLAGGPCRVMGPDLRIKAPRGSAYFYADGSVVCGQPQFDPDAGPRTTILNPRIIIEVLSTSTEAYDRGKKLLRYFQIPSLEEYVLVSQAEPRIDSFFRHADGSWSFNVACGINAAVTLWALKIELPLAEIYENVQFPADQPPAP